MQGPEDALTAFARELGGLLSTYAQAIEVRVTPAEGVELTDVVSDVDAREEGGSVVLRVPDLLADEVRNLVLGVRLAPRPVPLDAPVAVADVQVAFERLDGGRVVRERSACARDGAVRRRRRTRSPLRRRAWTRWSRSRSSSGRRSRPRRRRGEASSRRRAQVMVLFQEAVARAGTTRSRARRGRSPTGSATPTRSTGAAPTASSMRKGGTRGVVTLYQERGAPRPAVDGAGEDDRGAGPDGGLVRREARAAEAQRARASSSRGLTRKRSKRW